MGPVVAPVLEVEHGKGLASHKGNGLAGIHGASAAKHDDAVMVPRAEYIQPALDIGTHGIALDIREHGRWQAVCIQAGDGIRDHRQIDHAGIGHQQRVLHAQGETGLSQFRNASWTEANNGGKAPV